MLRGHTWLAAFEQCGAVLTVQRLCSQVQEHILIVLSKLMIQTFSLEPD